MSYNCYVGVFGFGVNEDFRTGVRLCHPVYFIYFLVFGCKENRFVPEKLCNLIDLLLSFRTAGEQPGRTASISEPQKFLKSLSKAASLVMFRCNPFFSHSPAIGLLLCLILRTFAPGAGCFRSWIRFDPNIF